jgi:hypothetical protein
MDADAGRVRVRFAAFPMPHVFLNPDGAQRLGLLVMVEAPTGVTYAHQCAGCSHDYRVVEGFLIPLGGADTARPFHDWFWRNFRQHGYPPIEWTEQRASELASLVTAVPCWLTPGPPGDDRRAFLELDTDRLEECADGWVPVRTPYGRGILVFENSD